LLGEEPEATAVNRLSRRIWAGATGAALLLVTGAVAAVPASAAPRAATVTCPTVDPATGAVTPAPAASVDWSGCDLAGANLTSASLLLADLSGATLTSANLTKADFDGADLSGANLTKANLTNVWLGSTNSTGANFTGAAGAGAYFTSADLTGADFSGVKLSGDVMVFATLTSAKFARADLDHADLTGVSAAKADLTNANLTYASIASTPGGLTGNPSYGMFNGADLTNANLAHANVSGAGLAGANLTGVKSGALSGVAASLPANFSETDGYLVGPSGLLHITATGKPAGQTAAAWFTVAASWHQARYDSGLTGDNTVENTLSPAKAPKLAKKFVFNPATAGRSPPRSMTAWRSWHPPRAR
jgi:uncharacterized protein YjbI with pentapeptide repeats